MPNDRRFGSLAIAALSLLGSGASCDAITNYPGASELPPAPVAAPKPTGHVPAPPRAVPKPPVWVSCDPAHPTCAEGEACCERCCNPALGPVCMKVTEGGACPLPDLTVDPTMLQASVAQDVLVTGPKTCPEALECLGGTGTRDLLRFTTASRNDGVAPFWLGKPPERTDLFHWSDCEQHFRQGRIMEFRLKDNAGNVVATGHKAGFCLMDDMDTRQTGAMPSFTCADQGISPGWADLYGNPLDCQWVDVTGVKQGDYTLEVEINADRKFVEADYGNNISTARVHLGR